MLLYGPHSTPGSQAAGVSFKNGDGKQAVENVSSYDIVVQSDRNIKNCYSVFRCTNVTDVNTRFDQLKKILPHYLSARQEMCNTGQLVH